VISVENHYIDSGKSIRQPELSGNPTNRHLAVKQEDMGNETINVAYEASLSYFNMP
jgi:hypothetical protein